MNDFFANLYWRMPMKSTPGNRWTTWARSLSTSRRRIYSRHRVAVMQLLRPAIPIYRSSHRWEMKAWSLFPRINLVIRPILMQLDAKRSSRLPATPATSAPRSSSTSEVRKDFLTVRRAAAEGQRKSANVTAVGARQLLWSAEKVPTTEIVAGQNPALRYSTFPIEFPLNRVFRRLLAADIQTEHRTMLMRESVKVARRVVEETRRVEHSSQTAMVTKHDHVAHKILDTVRGRETKLLEQLSELKTAPSIMHGNA